MDAAKAKYFVYIPYEGKHIYTSKDLNAIMQKARETDRFYVEGSLEWIYALVETESGETLFYMDYSYAGEPIIMGRFIHWDYMKKHHFNRDIIKI